MTESDFIAALRRFATHPAAQGLLDDAAVLEIGGTRLVLTHDMIVENVHFLSADPPADLAWKLLAVNLSDLAAKGADPIGALLGYSLGESEWDETFAAGLAEAIAVFGVPLLGGDTVSAPPGSARAFGLTAIGRADGPVPSRAGAEEGDLLWVSGSVGDSGAGLRILREGLEGPESLAERYRRPRPRLEAGKALAPLVTAMMDVSDGLLLDASRMAEASGLAVTVQLDRLPLSPDYAASFGKDRAARLAAATAGDDYELLLAAAQGASADIEAVTRQTGLALTAIGSFGKGSGLRLRDGDEELQLPDRLGYQHAPSRPVSGKG